MDIVSLLKNREFQKRLTILTQVAWKVQVHSGSRGWVSTFYTHPVTHLRHQTHKSTLFASNIYAIFIKLLRYLHQTSTICFINIAYMYIVDIGFLHGAEPIFIMRVAYTHIVSIGSAACQEPLRYTSKVTPLTAQLLQFAKTIPLYTKHTANHDTQGVCAWCIVAQTLHQLYTILFTMIMNRP